MSRVNYLQEDFDMNLTALILIDIQNDYFTGGLMPLPGMDSAEATFFRPGTEGSNIHDAVQPQPGEKVFKKEHLLTLL